MIIINLFNLTAKLSLDSTEYESGLNKAENKTSGLKSTIAKLGIGAALGTMGKAALNVGMDFEKSMSQVAGTMGISADAIKAGDKSFESLSAAARKAGRTTQFSAAQGAEGLNYMALAGLNAEESIELLPKVLNLATAGSMGLAEASDMVTDGMTALGIELEYADGFLDQMAVSSQKSNTSISQLGQAMLTVGGTAKILKGGTLDMNTALGILADAGTKGAEGGTALRNVILSLTSPTDKASKELKKMGISVFDSKGEMRGLQDILMDLDKSLSSMTDEKKTQVLSKIFNKVDLKSINALLDNSNERWTKLQTNIEESAGATEAMAKTVNDNLSGALTSMGSALGDVGIAVYEKFKTPLTEAVQGLTQMVVNLVEAFESGKLDKTLSLIGAALASVVTQMVIMKTINIVSVISTFATTVIKAASMVKSFSGAMAVLNMVMNANPIGLIVTAISALVGAIFYLWNTNDNFKNAVIKGWGEILRIGQEAWGWVVNFFTNTIPKVFTDVKNWFITLPDSFKKGLDDTIKAVSEWYDNVVKWFEDLVKSVGKWFVKLGKDIWKSMRDTYLTLVSRSKEIYESVTEWISKTVKGFIRYFSELPGRLWSKLVKVYDQVVKWGSDIYNSMTEWISKAIDATIKWFEELPFKIGYYVTKGLMAIYEFGVNTYNYLSTQIPKIIESVGKWFSELPGKIWNSLVLAYDSAVKWGQDTWQSMTTKAKEMYDSVTNWFSETYNSIKNSLKEAYDSAVKWGQDTWESITTSVSNFYKSVTEWFSKIPGVIWNWLVQAYQNVSKWAVDMWNKAKQAGSDFLSAIGTFFSQLPGKVWNWLVQTYNKATTFAGNLARKGFEAGKNFATNIVNAIKNLPSQFYNIGSDIVRGVWNGIVGMGSWIANKVKWFFGGIVDGAKAALGIHSPSRIFRDEVGQWIPKGVEVGIEREMPNLQRTVEQEFSNLANVDIESPQYNIQAKQNDFFDKIQNLKVEVPLVMDGIEVARAIVEPFKEIEREYDETHNIKFAYN